MTYHVLCMLLAGMQAERIELLAFRFSDRSAVITAASDDDAKAIARDLGIELRVTTSGGTSWLTGTYEIDGIGLVVSGPMRKRLEVVDGR